jgi:hypothetical protein
LTTSSTKYGAAVLLLQHCVSLEFSDHHMQHCVSTVPAQGMDLHYHLKPQTLVLRALLVS